MKTTCLGSNAKSESMLKEQEEPEKGVMEVGRADAMEEGQHVTMTEAD